MGTDAFFRNLKKQNSLQIPSLTWLPYLSMTDKAINEKVKPSAAGFLWRNLHFPFDYIGTCQAYRLRMVKHQRSSKPGIQMMEPSLRSLFLFQPPLPPPRKSHLLSQRQGSCDGSCQMQTWRAVLSPSPSEQTSPTCSLGRGVKCQLALMQSRHTMDRETLCKR